MIEIMNKRGAGRPELPDFKKRRAKCFTLSQEALHAIDKASRASDQSQSAIVEECIWKAFKRPS